MAITFVGFYRPDPTSPAASVVRETGGPPPDMAKKVNEFPTKLPPTCKLIGSWVVSGGPPSVIVVEVENYSDLEHINTYYTGWVQFEWHPTRSMRRDW